MTQNHHILELFGWDYPDNNQYRIVARINFVVVANLLENWKLFAELKKVIFQNE